MVTTHKIKKELSICQSSSCLDLVSFPVLSQIKPQAPINLNCLTVKMDQTLEEILPHLCDLCSIDLNRPLAANNLCVLAIKVYCIFN